MSISDRIRKLCEQNNITINRLESMLEIGRGNVARWDTHNPNVGRVKKVADYFGVSVEYLLGEESYYSDHETDEYADRIHKDPNLRILFDATKDLNKEDIDIIVRMAEGLKAVLVC